ncbi:hypothetical protein AGMMS49959_18750 [Planctomycetales bacterium]|nr:hypothetical protein AGMMS49959_18750 [Planctomycetales bacterium]
MSLIQITDRRGGVFETVITFTYGECARLPFNALRKINARLDQIRDGGVKATAQFNLRQPAEAANFIEVLDLFGEDGSYVHGSPADPADLKKETPRDDETPRPWRAESEKKAVPDLRSATDLRSAQPSTDRPAASAVPSILADDETVSGDDGLEIEKELFAADDWQKRAAAAIAQALAEHENREETLARVAKVAGDRCPEAQTRATLIQILWEKFQDEAYVAAFLKRREWDNVTAEEISAAVNRETTA